MGYANTGTIRGIDMSNMVFMLNAPGMKRGHAPASANSGTIPVAEGDAGPGTITATLTNMASGYGYRRDLASFLAGDPADYILTNWAPTITDASKLWIRTVLHYDPSANWEVICGARDDASNYWFAALDSDNPGQLVYTFVKAGTVKKAHSSTTLSEGQHVLDFIKDGGTIQIYIDGVEVSYGRQDTYNHGALGISADMQVMENGAATYYFRGLIYSFAIHDDTPTAAELTAAATLAPDWGLEMLATGQLVDPTAAQPTAVPGLGSQYGISTNALLISLRDEYDHTDSTIPVYIDESRIPSDFFNAIANENCGDVIATDTSGTLLPTYRTSRCSKAASTLGMLVRLPATGSGYAFMLQCGGNSVANGNPFANLGPSDNQNAIRAYEAMGGDIVDVVGLGSLTKYNSPTFPSGPFGTHMNLDGINQRVDDADAADLSFGNGSVDSPFSVFAIGRMADTTNYVIAAKYASSNREYEFRYPGSDKITLALWDESANAIRERGYTVASTWRENLWMSFCSTYGGDQSDPLSDINLYEDGEVVDNNNNVATGSYTAMESLGADLQIGYRPQYNNYSNGDFALLALLPYELSANESRMLHDVYQGTFLNEDNAAFDIASSTWDLTANIRRNWTPYFRYGSTSLTLDNLIGPDFPKHAGEEYHTFATDKRKYSVTQRYHGTTAPRMATSGIKETNRDTIWTFWNTTLDVGYNDMTVIDHRSRMLFETSWNAWGERFSKERGGVFNIEYDIQSPVPWTPPVWGCYPSTTNDLTNHNLSGDDLVVGLGEMTDYASDANVLRKTGYALKVTEGGGVARVGARGVVSWKANTGEESVSLFCQFRCGAVVGDYVELIALTANGLNNRFAIAVQTSNELTGILREGGGTLRTVQKSDTSYNTATADTWYDACLAWDSVNQKVVLYMATSATTSWTEFLDGETSLENGVTYTLSGAVSMPRRSWDTLTLINETSDGNLDTSETCYVQNAFVFDGFVSAMQFNTLRRLCYLWNNKTTGTWPA